MNKEKRMMAPTLGVRRMYRCTYSITTLSDLPACDAHT
jgi:hypothetical protein